MPGKQPRYGRCAHCTRVVAMFPRGDLYEHHTKADGGHRCDGSFRPAEAEAPRPPQARASRQSHYSISRELWFEDITGEPRL